MREPICRWPALPELPPPGGVALICVRAGSTRTEKRRLARRVLRQLLAVWSRLPPEELPLKETPRGPAWDGRLQGEALEISLSYSDSEAWIALSRGNRIGVDVMSVQAVSEAEMVAQHYFDPGVRAALLGDADPDRAFALAWTQLEARCKCLGQDLNEWSAPDSVRAQSCSVQSTIVEDRLAIAVATAGRPSSLGFPSRPLCFLIPARIRNEI